MAWIASSFSRAEAANRTRREEHVLPKPWPLSLARALHGCQHDCFTKCSKEAGLAEGLGRTAGLHAAAAGILDFD